MTTEALATAFHEIAAAMNSRPVSTDTSLGEETTITVNRLLTSKPCVLPPSPGEFGNEEIYMAGP